ncbi:Uncharacterized protein TCM_037598 [Theobroma cacao]|uniref:Reverse transcriptase zinc-binding domain-containing protein n=1 Tax=Theobroma cacao TaxID=3641 RepID=A0A061GLD9_THECC|nr:Uncharacterized protein TCM_037598 [Theobroma cacao]
MEDKIVWRKTASGKYTVKSFCKEVIPVTNNNKGAWKQIWSNLAPFRIEVFCWQLLQEKVAIKQELVRRGLMTSDSAVCVLCHKEYETGEAQSLENAFYAIAWSVWLHKNEMVFKGVVWDAKKVYELSKLRVATWAKAKWPQNYGMVLHTYQNPMLGKISTRLPWRGGDLGSVERYDGQVQAIFSKTIGVGDASLAEVRTIREAFLVFAASKWSQTHKLIIESDSKNAVKWINGPAGPPWRLRKWTMHVESLKRNIKGGSQPCLQRKESIRR